MSKQAQLTLSCWPSWKKLVRSLKALSSIRKASFHIRQRLTAMRTNIFLQNGGAESGYRLSKMHRRSKGITRKNQRPSFTTDHGCGAHVTLDSSCTQRFFSIACAKNSPDNWSGLTTAPVQLTDIRCRI